PAGAPVGGGGAGGPSIGPGPMGPSGAPVVPGAPQVPGVPQGQPPINRLFGAPTPGNMPPMAAFLSEQLSPKLFEEYAKSQWAPVRSNAYGPDANGQRVFYPPGIPGVAVPPGDPNFLPQAKQFTTQQEGIKQRAIGARESGQKFLQY